MRMMNQFILAAAVLAMSAGSAFASGRPAQGFVRNAHNAALCATQSVRNLADNSIERYPDKVKHIWIWNFKNPREASVRNITTGQQYSFNLNKNSKPVYSGNKVTYFVTGTQKGVRAVSFQFPKDGTLPSNDGYTISAGILTMTSQDKVLTADCLFKGK